MTTPEARELIGKFGEIHANGDKYPKWLHGKITEVDKNYTMFTDNNGFIHLFKTVRIIYFKEKELKC